MFGDLMGNFEQQQAEMQKKLARFVIEFELEGIKITGNAAREVTNVSISDALWAENEKEKIEDLLLTVMNRFLEKSAKVEVEESGKMMSEMLPPGFGDLFK